MCKASGIHVVGERRYKEWRHFLLRKNDDNNFVLELVAYVYKDNKGQINLDPES